MSDNQENALPCPFCGHMPGYWPLPGDPYRVVCSNPSCAAGVYMKSAHVSEWNRRAAPSGAAPLLTAEMVKEADHSTVLPSRLMPDFFYGAWIPRAKMHYERIAEALNARLAHGEGKA